MLALASAEWVALVGAAATISAAAILAGVAAITTNRRQTKALNDAGERQERALAADADRQERELVAGAERQRRELNARSEEQQQLLDHARGLADLADLRQLLDEAAAALNDAVDASHRLDMTAGEHGSSLAHNAGDEVVDCGRRLVTLNARLQVRLGKDDPVALHFDEGCNAMWESWRHAHPSPEETGTELIERRKQMRDAWQALNTSLDAFLSAAVKRAGTVPMHGG